LVPTARPRSPSKGPPYAEAPDRGPTWSPSACLTVLSRTRTDPWTASHACLRDRDRPAARGPRRSFRPSLQFSFLPSSYQQPERPSNVQMTLNCLYERVSVHLPSNTIPLPSSPLRPLLARNSPLQPVRNILAPPVCAVNLSFFFSPSRPLDRASSRVCTFLHPRFPLLQGSGSGPPAACLCYFFWQDPFQKMAPPSPPRPGIHPIDITPRPGPLKLPGWPQQFRPQALERSMPYVWFFL